MESATGDEEDLGSSVARQQFGRASCEKRALQRAEDVVSHVGVRQSSTGLYEV